MSSLPLIMHNMQPALAKHDEQTRYLILFMSQRRGHVLRQEINSFLFANHLWMFTSFHILTEQRVKTILVILKKMTKIISNVTTTNNNENLCFSQ